MKDFYSKYLCHSYCLLFFLYLANSSYVSAQTLGTNYLRVRVPQIAVTDSLALDSIPIIRQSVSISYTDGLGRALQEVLVQGSPGYKDIIAPHVYDSMGRESTVYLPYSDQGTTGVNSGSLRANAVQNVLNFYNPASPGAPKVATDLNPYFQTTYETSPLARVVEQGSLGSGYQVGSGHTVTSSYQVNSPIDKDVYLWTIFSGFVASRQVYQEGALTETIITDPNGHHYKEWKDLQERLISRMQVDAPNANYVTSYIYNDLSQLAYMVTPGAVREFGKKGSYSFVESPSDPIFMEHIYAYHYDSVSRQVEKKLPGKGWQYTVYNKQDQAVLTQDSNQRRKGQWNFIKYDAQARVIQTGIYINSSIKTRRAMQFLCDNNPVFWEIYKPGVGYTDNAFPQLSTTSSGTTPLSVYTKVYYDDYTFSEAAAKSYQKNTLDTGYSKRTEGLVTGQSVLLLGSAGTFLTTVSYYDAENRLIQQIMDNHLGQVDTITNQYNFIGELVKSKAHTSISSTISVSVQNRYGYDQIGRQVDTWESYQNMPELLLSHLEYNEIGQLIAKHLNLTNYTGLLPQTIVESAVLTTSKADVATVSVSLNPGFSITGSATNIYSASIGSSGGTFAQTNEYRYTIRGQLRTINNPSLIADKGITQSDSAALFGEQVNYAENTGLVGTPQYNGNISSISWRNKIEVSGQPGVVGGTQGYTFGYDGVDRQTSSSYFNLVGATWTQSSVDAFSENVPKYDEMGNIDSLVRKDKSGNVVNRLSYKYASNGNKLAGVTDIGTEGFSSSYTYDGNGNMTSDTKKGITLTYNYLDLVDTIKQGTSRLVYTYDATGQKCYKQLITSGGVSSQRHYVENLEATATSSLAKDGQIEFVATPEGRLVNTGGGNYQQEYFVTDHLGNIRVAFRVNTNGTLNLTQVQNYYSFGKDMGDATMNYTASPQNQYKYSSKELQQELSLMNYDFGARHYDPRIGRWTGVDMLAETYENVSPYNYVANSPINNIDLNGMGICCGIPCPKWGEPSGGLNVGGDVVFAVVSGLLGSFGHGPVALNKTDAPGQQSSFQSRSNITSSLNEDGTTVQQGGDPGGNNKANANQGGNTGEDNASGSNFMKAITSRTEMVDAGWTAARAPALLSKSYGAAAKAAGKLGAMRFLGRVTGALSLYTDYNDYKEAKAKGHIWGAAWSVTKGVMQVGFLLGGGEEIELGWNLGTMAIDGIINYKKKD